MATFDYREMWVDALFWAYLITLDMRPRELRAEAFLATGLLELGAIP